MLTFGSLFSGIGGIDLGLERAGLRCAWQVEIDDYAQRVLAKHWPDVLRLRDVRDCGIHNLPRVDLVAGGFPCQDISYAGLGAGLDGSRSGLWWEFARIIRELRPRYVLVENVAALLTRGLDAVLGTLASFGYDAEWHCIPASAIGAPHIRDRIFIVAYTNGEWQPQPSGAIGQKRRWSGDSRDEANVPPNSNESNRRSSTLQVGRIGRAKTLAEARERARTQWSAEPELGRVAYGIPNWVDRLTGVGNAVVPQVSELLGYFIRALDEA